MKIVFLENSFFSIFSLVSAWAGFVLDVYKKEHVQIVPGVWADVIYARVWNAERGTPDSIAIWNSEFSKRAVCVEVDATPRNTSRI